ncbi:MAG: YihY/virulence factor BrkB family protein [Armatimonadota bacterium]
MKQRAREIWSVLVQAHESFLDHLGPLKAGSIAFFATLSLFPLALLLVSVTGRIIGSQQAYDGVATLVREYMPGVSGEVLAAIDHARSAGRHLLVDAVGVLGLIWSATNLFATLSQALTVVWFGEPRRGFLRRRAVSLLAVLVAGLLFFASVVVTSALAALSSYAQTIEEVARLREQLRFLDSAAAWTVHTAAAALMFFLVYWIMPAGRVAARAAAIVAAPAALFWMVSRGVFAVIVTGSTRYGHLYGPLTGAVVLLLWIYYSAYIMVYCGEIGGALQARYWPARGTTTP